MRWGLENLKRCGFEPSSVIDVGAFIGDWTRQAREIWPQAKFLMVEPQPNRHESLRKFCDDRVSLSTALLGAKAQDAVPFHMDDLGGSSVLEQYQDKCPRGTSLPMTTLDIIAGKMAGPIFLKADVQGFELEVLQGATETLKNVEAILLEVSFLPYNIGAPLFAEVVAFLAARNFLVYDICFLHRRQSDEAAFQGDVIFVQESSNLRAERPFFGKLP